LAGRLRVALAGVAADSTGDLAAAFRRDRDVAAAGAFSASADRLADDLVVGGAAAVVAALAVGFTGKIFLGDAGSFCIRFPRFGVGFGTTLRGMYFAPYAIL
jgi:hypothetical protein